MDTRGEKTLPKGMSLANSLEMSQTGVFAGNGAVRLHKQFANVERRGSSRTNASG